ncbi:MAG: hypothetical protein OEO21_05270 [Candidatus Krumholzibacteria bacterium]|nr:hypothetical protein [Candidatus Krumholzibacteria bacterium]
MKPLLPVLAIVVALTGGHARANVLEYALPELVGLSGAPPETTWVVYTGDVAVVTAVSLNITGLVSQLGVLECGQPPTPAVWTLDIGVSVRKPLEADYWSGLATLSETGTFDVTVALSPGGFTGLDPGDVIAVEYTFAPSAFPASCTPVGDPPLGATGSITLVLEVDYPIPLDASTWGRIKALYAD